MRTRYVIVFKDSVIFLIKLDYGIFLDYVVIYALTNITKTIENKLCRKIRFCCLLKTVKTPQSMIGQQKKEAKSPACRRQHLDKTTNARQKPPLLRVNLLR